MTSGCGGQLWDANNVAKVEWGLLDQTRRRFGRVTLKNGQTRTFFEPDLMTPYINAQGQHSMAVPCAGRVASICITLPLFNLPFARWCLSQHQQFQTLVWKIHDVLVVLASGATGFRCGGQFITAFVESKDNWTRTPCRGTDGLRRCPKKKPDSVPQLPDGFSGGGSEAIEPYQREETTMILTAIVVTGLVFTGIGAVIGYILGYIEAENHYRIKGPLSGSGAPSRSPLAERRGSSLTHQNFEPYCVQLSTHGCPSTQS
jgi:hypothetical protein